MPDMDDRGLVRREYASLDRLSLRRLDRTAWVRGDSPWDVALAAPRVRRRRVQLDALPRARPGPSAPRGRLATSPARTVPPSFVARSRASTRGPLTAPAGGYPFRASRRNVELVADPETLLALSPRG